MARAGLVSAMAAGWIGVAGLAPAASAVDPCRHAAHRGNHAGAGMTENGMPAIRAANRAFEVDVRTNASGSLVVMHDATVRRTTNGTGRVTKKTSKQIRRLRLDDGSRIPFLRTVFSHLRNNPRKKAVLHIKAVSGRKLIDQVRAAGVTGQVTFMSTHREQLDVATRYVPTVFLAFSAVRPARYKAYDAIAVPIRTVTARYVRATRASGLSFWTFASNDRRQWRRGVDARVNLVFTDRPGAFTRWCRSR